MAVRRAISQPDGVYFITITCARWLPLFQMVNGYDVVYNWFNHLQSRGHYIVGYVIMPHHLHSIIAFRNTDQSINTVIGNGKRFMAYELVERVNKLNAATIIEQMQQWVNTTDKKRNKKHEVFEPSFDWKECRTTNFIIQKLSYIHWNPCKGNSLAEVPEQYEHSSARYYITGEHAAFKVTSYMELEDVDLTAPL